MPTPFLQEIPALGEYIDFPLRFSEIGDVILTSEESSINDDLKTSTCITENGLPMNPFGAGIGENVFEQMDFGTEVYLAGKISEAAMKGNDNVVVAEETIQFQESENGALTVSIPYINVKTGNDSLALLTIQKQKTDY